MEKLLARSRPGPISAYVQDAHAKVALRLVDVKTGNIFFSSSGAGQ
jgi:curli biogenesis system outer membrane secretion channel CsgG